MTNIDSGSRRLSALGILASTGMWKSSYAPPIYRLLWRLGVDVPPPHFAGFWSNLAFCGCFFATGFGLYRWIFRCDFVEAAQDAAWGGLLFGLLMASFYALGRRAHALPPWADLPGAGPSIPAAHS